MRVPFTSGHFQPLLLHFSIVHISPGTIIFKKRPMGLAKKRRKKPQLVDPGQHESAERGNVTRRCIARKGPSTPMGMKVGSFVPWAVFMVNMMEHSVSSFQVTLCRIVTPGMTYKPLFLELYASPACGTELHIAEYCTTLVACNGCPSIYERSVLPPSLILHSTISS